MKNSFLLILGTFILCSCGVLDNPYQLEKVWLKGNPEKSANSQDLAGLALDAKQRIVWSPTIPVRTYLGDKVRPDGGVSAVYGPKERNLVCAEPSPDALSAITATLDGRTSFEKLTGTGQSLSANAEISRSISERVQQIGERGQVVQLLRDLLYRACEAYGNGVVDEFGYSMILGSIDTFTLQLITADALSRGQGSDLVGQERANLAAARASLVAAEEKLAAGTKLLRDAEAVNRGIADEKARATQIAAIISNLEKEKETKNNEIVEINALLSGNLSSQNIESLRKARADAENENAAALRAAENKKRLEEQLTVKKTELEGARAIATAKRSEANFKKETLGSSPTDDAKLDALQADTAAAEAELNSGRLETEVNAIGKELDEIPDQTEASAKFSNADSAWVDALNRRNAEETKLETKLAELEKIETELGLRRSQKARADFVGGSTEFKPEELRIAISEAEGAVAEKRAAVATAEGALAKATGTQGPGSTDTEVLGNLIESANRQAQIGTVRPVATACMQWFSRHPDVRMTISFDGTPVFSGGQNLPAIAVQCTQLLQSARENAREYAKVEALEAERRRIEASVQSIAVGDEVWRADELFYEAAAARY